MQQISKFYIVPIIDPSLLFLLKKKDGESIVFYLNEGSLRFLSRLLSLVPFKKRPKFEKVDFKYKNLKNEKGENLGTILSTSEIDNFCNSILHGSLGLRSNSELKEYILKQGYIKKIISTHKLYFFDNLTLKQILLTTKVLGLRFSPKKSEIKIFYWVLPTLWISIFSEFAKSYNVEFKVEKNTVAALRLALNFYFFSNIYLKGIMSFLRFSLTKKNLARKTVLSFGNFDRPKLVVDQVLKLFNVSEFWSCSEISSSKIIFVSKTHQPDAADLNDIRQAGMSYISLSSNILRNNDFQSFQPVFSRKKYKRIESDKIEAKVLEGFNQDFFVEKEKWKSLFEKTSAKVYLTHHKWTSHPVAATAAIYDLGGISGMWQMSFQDAVSPYSGVYSDLYFSFSPNSRFIEKENSSAIKYLIAIGYIGDFRFNSVSEKSKKFRKNLQSNGAKKIITFFDEGSYTDERWFAGHSTIQENYRFLLEKVLENDWLGLIIKPKKPGMLRTILGKVSALLDEAISTGRCYLYRKDFITPPVEAALASDVAIHDMLNGFTAGFEAALAGTPTLMFDSLGRLEDSTVNQLAEGKVVFDDWNILWDTLVRHWNKEAIHGFGDWGALLDEEDPFRDGKAAERMTTYVNWLLEGFDQGLDREKNMALAAERYSEIWGSEYVFQMN